MTINQAIRILDPETTAEELATIEYYGGLHGREKMVAACDEACRMAVQIRTESRFAATDGGKIVTLKDGYMELLTKWNWREKE